MKTIYITEEQKHKLSLLTEDKEGKNLAKARRYLELKGYTDPNQRQQILDSIRTDIPNSRLQQCKFMLGVVRLYVNGELNDGQSIAKLNKTLKYIASDVHVNEYDNNLNNESLQTLVNRFKGVAKDDLQQSMAASNARQLTVNQEYNIVPIDNAEEAAKYGKYTSWCVTHDSNMYDSYTNDGMGRFYFCLRNGFENEPKVEGEGCPLDSYGLSMIAVSITMEGEVNTITCRWNHDMNGNDNIMTIEQLEDLLGRNFYQTFKPYTREELHAKGIVLFDEVQDLLDSGKKPEEIFDDWGDFIEGFARVYLNDKWNFINREGKILSSQWFDDCDDFREGFARVNLNGKMNFISSKCKILSSQWFDRCDDFSEGFAVVNLNGKWNFINRECKILSSQWFDRCNRFSEGFGKVQLNGKYNYINGECKILSSQWFDGCGDFREGFAVVNLNDKFNYINGEGNILSSQWFDWCNRFIEGFARVQLNGKWNFINGEGKIISSQWFDYCDFIEGFAFVYLNGKWYKIDRAGRLYNKDGSPLSESKKNRRTVYITEEQAKHLKKKLSAQDQVGGKVNAGVMDAIVGGMCENVEDDEYQLAPESNEISSYYHVKESKLNESPDYIDFFDDRFNNSDAYPFIYLWNKQQLYIGQGGQTHIDVVNEIDQELNDDFSNPGIPYSAHCDEMLTGRYWQQHNVISFWKTPIDKRMNVRKVIDALKEQGIIQSSEYTVLDYWDNNSMSCCIFPIKWLFNGTYDMFAGRCSRIAPIKPLEYSRTGKYTYFQVTTNNSGIQCVNVSGNEILTGMEYYMKTSSMNEGVEDRNRMVDIRRIVQTDNFKRWFGNSKVVDENGFPIIVHHGSPKFEGDSFKKDKNGKSLNYGEQGVFCTTQDMSWAKRFSYPISQGSTSFTVKVDYSKPGDILSGFLKIEHPLDFFHLTDKDWENVKDIILNSYMEKTMSDEKLEELKYAVLIKNHQFLKHMISGYNKDNDFGNVLKKYGYDGYIALMDMRDTAVEYCFFEPNQFKSIYSLAFNPESDSIYEGRKKVVKNDEGEIVPEKCDKCGGDVVVQIHGEPVYICKDCGKYFGTMPFHLKESIDYKKWLRQLKKRRDPDNIEENIEIEDKWNGEGEKLEPLKRLSRVPEFLYHCSYTKNRESILKNGIYASVGDEYKDWWNYEGPNGEIPDDNELEYLVFLSSRPYTWADNYSIDKMDIYKIDTKQLDRHCFYFDPDRFMALKGSVCYTLNIPPSAIELFDTVYRHKSIKENIENEISPEDVDLSSFNIKRRLNPKFWVDGHLDSRIRLKLMDISDDFIEYLGIDPHIVKDIIMTGSLANFNWSEEFSDIDLHVLLDYSDVDENTEFVKQYFISQKNSWNNEHGEIKIFGFPVEVYVQDINEKHDSSGVYSLDKDKWLIEPDREVLATSKVNKKFIKDKVSDYTNKIDKLAYLYKKAKTDEYKLEKISDKANKLWDEIKTERKKGFEISGGKEINSLNIIFKTLRRNGYLDKLYQIKTKIYDKLMSI